MNEKKIEAFVGQVVTDLAAASAGVMTNIGHKLGLYRAMKDAGPVSAAELARRTQTGERYVLEWLNSQVAGGYLTYHPESNEYSLPPEHALVLADDTSPVFMPAAFDVVASMWLDEEKILSAFRTGSGLGWHEHHPCLFSGTEAFFRTGYRANLTSAWIPALEGVEEKLKKGAKVADVGCGFGASTILMAQAYPKSTFVGSDYHKASVEAATRRANEAGVGDRVRFELASAKTYGGKDFDLICFMDCFHDLGDPLGAAKHAKSALAPDGAILLVEPFASDRVEENVGPVGRLFYSASTGICCPNSLSQEVGAALGAQAGETRLRAMLEEAGFGRVRRATATPFNLILEARS